MNKLCILAALLLATTAAHAGNSVSFEIEGHRIHIEAPKNCELAVMPQDIGARAFRLRIQSQGLQGVQQRRRRCRRQFGRARAQGGRCPRRSGHRAASTRPGAGRASHPGADRHRCCIAGSGPGRDTGMV